MSARVMGGSARSPAERRSSQPSRSGHAHAAPAAIRLARVLGRGLAVAGVPWLLCRLAPMAFLERTSWHFKLHTPAELQRQLPAPQQMRRFVSASREEVSAVIEGADDRLLAVVGPCSIHDPEAAREYAKRLREVAKVHRGELLVLMRAYLEKPRTSVGWRGLISDPDLSGGEDLERGLALGRRVLLDVNTAGLPAAVEFLDPLVAPYLEDLVTYGSIGARTVESPTHRALAAGLPMPIGFKNARSGDLQSAVNAAVAASAPQRRLSVGAEGRLRVARAAGNAAGHVILRGGEAGPNYNDSFVSETAERLAKAGFGGRRIVVDCSHGNSGKHHGGQLAACGEVARQVAAGSSDIAGVMIESFLKPGSQPLEPGVTQPSELRYGLSVTDACLDFAATERLLVELARAVEARRAVEGSWQTATGGGGSAGSSA